MYCITLRSRTDARITGWYDGSDRQCSIDPKRQMLFDEKRDARPACQGGDLLAGAAGVQMRA
jgi:hypothetical protein